MARLVLLLLIISLPTLEIIGQGFSHYSEEFGIDLQNFGADDGMGVSFFDYNNDGWDDLTFVLNNDSVRLFQNQQGTLVPQPSPLFTAGDAKQPVWVDFDNDGDYDLFVTVMNGQTTLLENQDGQLVDITLAAGFPQTTDAMTYGCGWADYDNDGFLDVYVCNYNNADIANWLFHNNGDGTFTEVAQMLGVDNGSLTTYQCAWLDYDNDGWSDLMVNNDLTTPNALFRNNGDGTFEDVSVSAGGNIAIHAMSATVGDYDNDGDLDMYITNQPYGNVLLENDGNGAFNNIAAVAGVEIDALTWSATWIDYDNNLKKDLFVCSNFLPYDNQNYLFMNTEMGFIDASWLGVDQETKNSYGGAKGDLNNDGFYDLIVCNAFGDSQDFYQNDGGSNNFFKVDLEGTVSNRDGIGTWVKYWIDGQQYTDYTLCGENYLSQESHYEIYAIGEAPVVDSVRFEWPSGIEETYYNINAGSVLHVVEGYVPDVAVNSSADVICEGHTAELTLEGAFDSYLWSNGDTTQVIEISSPGEYWVEVTYNGGLTAFSEVLVIDAVEPADFEVVTEMTSCFGSEDGSVTIAEGEVELVSVLWQGQLIGDNPTDVPAGEYHYYIEDINGCLYEGWAEITQPDELIAEITSSDVSCFGGNDGNVVLTAQGGTAPYSLDLGENDPESLVAGVYEGLALDSNGCSVEIDFSISEPEELTAELEVINAVSDDGSAAVIVSGGTGDYSIEWSNGEEGESVDGLAAGDYSVVITDENGCELELTFTVEQADVLTDFDFEDLVIYPNPADNYIRWEGASQNLTVVEVIDNQGRVVLSHRPDGNQQLNISSLANGAYWVRMSGPEALHTVLLQVVR